MNIRKIAFNLKQQCCKININSIIKRMTQAEEDDEFYYEEKKKTIHSFLSDSCNTPFYNSYKGRNLNEFPVIKKSDIKLNPQAFRNPKYSDRDLIKIHTSGSYGTPFLFYITPKKKANQLAEVILSGRKLNYDIGKKHIYSRSKKHKSPIKLFLQNEIFIPCKELDNNFFEQTRKALKKKKVTSFIGFPSVITLVAEYCKKSGDKPSDFSLHKGGIITSSENLSSTQRDLFFEVFGCKTCSRYSTEETGVIANQYEKDGPFLVNSFHYIVEILSLDGDFPAREGEIGRIVITDLFSNAMPLIRYDIGDLAVCKNIKYDSFGHIIQFENLSGRIVQTIISPTGKKLYPLNIENIMEKHINITQYQFIQETEDSYKCLIVTGNPKLIEEEQIIKSLKKWLGKEANIKLIYVKEIKSLSSGKRPYVINNYVQNI